MVTDEMQEYIDELEISETMISPSMIFASPAPPDQYPELPWEILFDNFGSDLSPTRYSYKIVLSIVDQFIPSQYGEPYYVDALQMSVYSSLSGVSKETLEFSGIVDVGIDYVINDEIVIRFKELGIDSYHEDGICSTYPRLKI